MGLIYHHLITRMMAHEYGRVQEWFARENWSTMRKVCPSAIFSTTNSAWTAMALKQALHGKWMPGSWHNTFSMRHWILECMQLTPPFFISRNSSVSVTEWMQINKSTWQPPSWPPQLQDQPGGVNLPTHTVTHSVIHWWLILVCVYVYFLYYFFSGISKASVTQGSVGKHTCFEWDINLQSQRPTLLLFEPILLAMKYFCESCDRSKND
jgi:hypothetical protein